MTPWLPKQVVNILVVYIVDEGIRKKALAGAKVRSCVLQWFADVDSQKTIFQGEGILHMMIPFEGAFGCVRIFTVAGFWCRGSLTLTHFIRVLQLNRFPGRFGKLILGRCPCCFGQELEIPKCAIVDSCEHRKEEVYYVYLQKLPLISLSETKH